jgi:hypothetical protein
MLDCHFPSPSHECDDGDVYAAWSAGRREVSFAVGPATDCYHDGYF